VGDGKLVQELSVWGSDPHMMGFADMLPGNWATLSEGIRYHGSTKEVGA